MDKIAKFLKKISFKEREKALKVLEKIFAGDYAGLRFKKLKGFEDLYALRVGKMRIICKQSGEIYWPISADYRGDVYKNL